MEILKTDCYDGQEAFYIEKREIEASSDADYQYEEVPVDDDEVTADLDEDLDLAVRRIEDGKKEETIMESNAPRPCLDHPAEPVDDFLRNFLVKMHMPRTLECFQNEWYEKVERGELNCEDVDVVPDVYMKNQDLDKLTKMLRNEAAKYKNACIKGKEACIRLRKERDYHRMHHRRVVQEKNKLVTDIKRLQNYYRSYEPTLAALKSKYDAAISQKTLMMIERDRAMGQVTGLKSTLKNMESIKGPIDFDKADIKAGSIHPCGEGKSHYVDKAGQGPTQRQLTQERFEREQSEKDKLPSLGSAHPKDSTFPSDTRVNPALAHVKGPCAHLTRTGGFRLSSTNQAHSHPVSGLALHPRKQIIASVGDDNVWKMWSVPGAERIMQGDGHTDWLAAVDFHPSGAKLATGGGDCSLKIWEFSQARCLHTFVEHQQPIWGVSFHSCGDFVATASADNSVKIWDMNSLRNRVTLRGHADSVNSVQYLPYSNILVTSSADKTISLWDSRQMVCAQTFFGHMHSINDAIFNLRGDTIASCDSFGAVNLWDVRTCSPMAHADLGPHPANAVALDPAFSVLAVASNDATIKMYDIANGAVSVLTGHEDAVQSVLFDRNGEFLISGASDCTIRIWS